MSSVQPFSFRDLGSGVEPAMVVPTNFVASGSKAKKEEAPPPPPPPPTFSEDELKAAERDAYQKGFLDGIKEGKVQAETEQAEVDRRLTAQVESFSAAIAPLFFDYRELALNIRREMPRIALAISEKMVVQALSEEAIGVINEVVMRACEQMAGEPRLNITVHESLAPTLKHRLKTVMSNQAEPMQILVAGSTDIALADCRIEWAHGSMERSTETLWNNVRSVIDDMCIAAGRDAEQQLSFLQGNMAISAPVPVQAEQQAEHPPIEEIAEQKE